MAPRLRALAAAAASLLLLAGCATPTPIPPGLTDAEADEVVAEQLAETWTAVNRGEARDMPAFERVSYTTPDTWSSAQVSCLVAAGIDASEVSGGYMVSSDGTVSNRQIADAQMVCLGQYPVDPRTQGYLSDSQLLYAYDYLTERVAPCLDLLGFPSSGPPDRPAFVGAVRAGQVWTPYSHGGATRLDATAAEWTVINGKCPPLPADPFAMFQPPVAG